MHTKIHAYICAYMYVWEIWKFARKLLKSVFWKVPAHTHTHMHTQSVHHTYKTTIKSEKSRQTPIHTCIYTYM